MLTESVFPADLMPPRLLLSSGQRAKRHRTPRFPPTHGENAWYRFAILPSLPIPARRFTQVIGFLQRRYPQANITAVNAAIGGSAAGECPASIFVRVHARVLVGECGCYITLAGGVAHRAVRAPYKKPLKCSPKLQGKSPRCHVYPSVPVSLNRRQLTCPTNTCLDAVSATLLVVILLSWRTCSQRNTMCAPPARPVFRDRVLVPQQHAAPQGTYARMSKNSTYTHIAGASPSLTACSTVCFR